MPAIAWLSLAAVLVAVLAVLVVRRRRDLAVLEGPDTVAALEGVEAGTAAAAARVDQLLSRPSLNPVDPFDTPADGEAIALAQRRRAFASPAAIIGLPVLEAHQVAHRPPAVEFGDGGERVDQ